MPQSALHQSRDSNRLNPFPEWLGRLRNHAQDTLSQLPSPKKSDEKWRFTDLEKNLPKNYQPLTASRRGKGPSIPRELEAHTTALPHAGLIMHGNQSPSVAELVMEAQEQGVILSSLEHASRRWESLARPYLGSLFGDEEFFPAHNLALHHTGTFLYVPKGAVIKLPIQAMTWLTGSGNAFYPRNLIVVEEGAQVSFHDRWISPLLDHSSMVIPVTELLVGANAKVEWMTWQEWGRGMRQIAYLKAHLEHGAQLNHTLISLGGDFSRFSTAVELAGEGATCTLRGAYFPTDSQIMEHWTLQDHQAPLTKSDLLYHGVLKEKSRSLYYGTIRILTHARKADAYQLNRNLVLSEGAHADTNPQLEIENNDVRCTHGSSVGPVDEEQLFYLTSRGITRSEAMRLVLMGFFEKVVGPAGWSGMQDEFHRALLSKTELTR